MSKRGRIHSVHRPSMDSLLRNSIRRNKKVKFDLATVSFQVDYPKPKRKAWVEVVPENVKWCDEIWARLANSSSITETETQTETTKSKENIVLFFFRQFSFFQWTKLLIYIICFIQFIFTVWNIVLIFRRNLTHSSVKTSSNDIDELPAFTLCFPVIIAFQNNCANKGNIRAEMNDKKNILSDSNTQECKNKLPVSTLFNQSHSEFGHQCKIQITKPDSLRGYQLFDCSSFSVPIETFYQNERCITYLSEVAVFRQNIPRQSIISLLIHSNRVGLIERSVNTKPRIFVHSPQELIFNHNRHFPEIKLELSQRYKIKYRSQVISSEWHSSFFNCQNYSERQASKNTAHMDDISRQQCLDQCHLQNSPCSSCLSIRNPIRKDLLWPTDELCLIQDCLNESESLKMIVKKCLEICPEECQQTNYETFIKHDKSSENELDLANLNAIQVQIDRDEEKESILLEQFPLMDRDSFIAQIGGCGAFWLIVAWLCCLIVKIFEFFYEIFQLYKQ